MQSDQSPIIVVTHHLAVEAFANLAVALEIGEQQRVQCLTLSDSDAHKAASNQLKLPVRSFESAYRDGELKEFTLHALHEKYANVPWNTVVAAERSFTDYSFLFGGTGYRAEKDDYVVPLVLHFVAFFEQAYSRLQPKAVVTAFGDNIFTLIATIVAEEKNIRVILPQPAFLNEAGALEAGYMGNTRYLESFAMVRCYQELCARSLTDTERERAEAFAQSLISYDGGKTLEYIYKKKDFEKPITPHRNRLFGYLADQSHLDASVEFYKIDWKRKIGANLKRIFRARLVARFLRKMPNEVPQNSVFYPMHFQPEASTLINGIWYANQIALIETLSKALPLGYTLIVKEHPRGRGMRPLWQYKHINALHNVELCDLPSKEILHRCDMVVSISGSIGLEGLAMGKPVLMLGRTFHTFNKLYYRANSPEELSEVMRKILLDKIFEKRQERKEEVARFFLAYLNAMYDFFPVGKRMADLAPLILKELEYSPKPSIEWIENVLRAER